MQCHSLEVEVEVERKRPETTLAPRGSCRLQSHKPLTPKPKTPSVAATIGQVSALGTSVTTDRFALGAFSICHSVILPSSVQL